MFLFQRRLFLLLFKGVKNIAHVLAGKCTSDVIRGTLEHVRDSKLIDVVTESYFTREDIKASQISVNISVKGDNAVGTRGCLTHTVSALFLNKY